MLIVRGMRISAFARPKRAHVCFSFLRMMSPNNRAARDACAWFFVRRCISSEANPACSLSSPSISALSSSSGRVGNAVKYARKDVSAACALTRVGMATMPIVRITGSRQRIGYLILFGLNQCFLAVTGKVSMPWIIRGRLGGGTEIYRGIHQSSRDRVDRGRITVEHGAPGNRTTHTAVECRLCGLDRNWNGWHRYCWFRHTEGAGHCDADCLRCTD